MTTPANWTPAEPDDVVTRAQALDLDAIRKRLEHGGEYEEFGPETVGPLLDEVERLTVLAKQVEDLDTRNQRLTGDWKAALAEVERLGATIGRLDVATDELADSVTQVTAERDAARAEVADMRATIVELAPPDEVEVEGSIFQRSDLPRVLGNFMRSSADYARQAKEALAEVDRLEGTVRNRERQANIARDECDRLREAWRMAEPILAERDALARKIERVRALADRIERREHVILPSEVRAALDEEETR